jgi:hypothetical protein
MANREVYVSTDIETDGPIPGANSMLSFASVAYEEGGQELGVFTANLETLAGATPDPRTMEWWQNQPAAWAACRTQLRAPREAMQAYDQWLQALPGRPVFVAYPLLFDMMFVYWYQMRFVGASPFSHSGIDIKTMAYVALGSGHYRAATKRTMPQGWLGTLPHTHVALDDARGQGELFFNIRNVLKARTQKDQVNK